MYLCHILKYFTIIMTVDSHWTETLISENCMGKNGSGGNCYLFIATHMVLVLVELYNNLDDRSNYSKNVT